MSNNEHSHPSQSVETEASLASPSARQKVRRNRRLRRMGVLLAVSVIMLGGVISLFSWQDQKARDRVDAALESPEGSVAAQPELPHTLPHSSGESTPRFPESDFGFDSDMEPESGVGMPDILRHFPSLPGGIHSVFAGMDNGVNVQEKADSYVLRVPLASHKDAGEVNLQVSTHHIQISGRTGSAPNEPGVSVMSTFMQSFDTSQALLPDKVRRQVQEKGGRYELVITVPKANPTVGRSANSPATPERSTAHDGFFNVPPAGSARSGQAGGVPDGFSVPPSHGGQLEDVPLGEGTGVF